TRRPSVAASSRRICGSPTSGRTSTAPAGPRPSSASIAIGSGAMPTPTAATGTASCCAGPGAGAIAIRRRRLCRRWRACRGSRACRSLSTRTRRRSGIPCPRVDFGWRSSTPSTWRKGRRRARSCANISWARSPPSTSCAPIAYSRAAMQGNHLIVRAAIALTIAAAALASMPSGAWAQGIPKDLADKLTPAQLATYETYRTARDRFERQLKIYWHRVEAKRDARKAKRMLGQEYEAEDYIAVQPPKYAGPELPPEIAKIVTEVKPPIPERPLATVADFLTSAKEQYGFVPTPTTEREFKRRYAQEALAVGLSKDQVVRIYALETGGQGTYDMQSGFNPITK